MNLRFYALSQSQRFYFCVFNSQISGLYWSNNLQIPVIQATTVYHTHCIFITISLEEGDFKYLWIFLMNPWVEFSQLKSQKEHKVQKITPTSNTSFKFDKGGRQSQTTLGLNNPLEGFAELIKSCCTQFGFTTGKGCRPK